METIFKPKYKSEYNKPREVSNNSTKVTPGISFVARKVSIEKRVPMQVSYETRAARENLRVYNG